MQKYIDLISKKYTIKIITLSVIVFYFLVPISLSNHLMNMSMNDSMNMSMDYECTHITGENSFCDVNIFNHLNLWKNISMFVSVSAKIISPVVVLFLVFISINFAVNNLFLYLKRKRFKDILILYSELFSSGILNSKTF